jgi:hypothetical protein
MRFKQFLMEMPEGWDKESAKKFVKTIGVDVDKKGAFDEIRTELKKKDIPEDRLDGMTASIIDVVKGNTDWRTGPKGIHKENNINIKESDEYDGRKVTLDKPFRTPDGPKKFAVYVKNDEGKVVIVRFGDPDSEIKRDNPVRRKGFRSRHSCDDDPPKKWEPRYWACKTWEKGKTVSDIIGD